MSNLELVFWSLELVALFWLVVFLVKRVFGWLPQLKLRRQKGFCVLIGLLLIWGPQIGLFVLVATRGSFSPEVATMLGFNLIVVGLAGVVLLGYLLPEELFYMFYRRPHPRTVYVQAKLAPSLS